MRNLLEDKKFKDERLIIFSWLSVIENWDPETVALIENFKKNPANKGVIDEAQPQIAHFNTMYK